MDEYVICQKGYTFPGEDKPSFTRGKMYPVLSTRSNHVNGLAIVNDLGQVHWIHEPGHVEFDEYFEVVKE